MSMFSLSADEGNDGSFFYLRVLDVRRFQIKAADALW